MSKRFKLSSEDWLIEEKGFHPHKQGVYETLFTLGNGYLGVRGSLEENPHGSYRGVYIAGVFDKSEGMVPEIVKAPGWIDLSVWVGDQKFAVNMCKVLSHKRILDMKKGVLHRITRLKDKKGRIIRLETRRVVFAHQVRGAVIDFDVTPENFSGEIKVISALNGDVTNTGYYPRERIKHLNLVKMERGHDHIYLEVETRDEKVKIGMAASLVFNNPVLGHVKVNRIYGEKFSEEVVFDATKKKTYCFTKWVTTFASREGYERQLKSSAVDMLHDMIYDGLDYHLDKHLLWRCKEWDISDVKIKGDRRSQKGLRFNIYHLIVAKPHHDQTVSLAAKFLTGEGYKGHAFWDTEIFMLPFYVFTFPEDARNLLMYRYYTLKGALENAKDLGYKGAKYAWESAGTGRETTPSFGYRPDGTKDKIFTGEEEHHIVSDVIYGLYKYVEASGDTDFLYNYGAEMVFQTARFWLSRVEKRRDRYEIRKTIGPDEFHEHVDNNAFTNYLALWNLSYAEMLYKKMKKEVPSQLNLLAKKLHLKKDEVDRMKLVSKILYFPYDQKTELIEQFEGYFSLDNVVVTELNKHGLPEWPKGIEGSTVHRTQLLKQADVVLLLYLFLDRFSAKLKKLNYDYYEPRTMHKSSLSPCIYAIMGLEVGDHKKAYNYFLKTSYIDLVDANKNTEDGIHGAAMGGAWMTAIHGFAGMKVKQGTLCFEPWLPKRWKELDFTIFWKGNLMRIRITHNRVDLKLVEGKDKSVPVNVYGKTVKVKHGSFTTLKAKKKY